MGISRVLLRESYNWDCDLFEKETGITGGIDKVAKLDLFENFEDVDPAEAFRL